MREDVRPAWSASETSVAAGGQIGALYLTTPARVGGMSHPLTIEPDVADEQAGHLDALPDWAASLIEYVEAAARAGEVVEVTSRQRTYTPTEASDRLGLSRTTILRRIADGKLAAVKVGNRHRIPHDELKRFWRETITEMAELYADEIAEELAAS